LLFCSVLFRSVSCVSVFPRCPAAVARLMQKLLLVLSSQHSNLYLSVFPSNYYFVPNPKKLLSIHDSGQFSRYYYVRTARLRTRQMLAATEYLSQKRMPDHVNDRL
jgi:hypothetical protein